MPRQPPSPPSTRPASRRQAAVVIGLVGAVALLALGADAWRAATSGGGPPTGPAEWIWAELPRQAKTPVAFYALCDFELAAVPERAELLAVGDEEYLLYLNGRRVGSNVYRPGAPLDVYEVAPLLAAGRNRIAVELRSGRSAGGFLAALVDPGSGEYLAVTDGSWRLASEQQGGLVEGDRPLDGMPPVRVWGRPPTGRWGVPARGPLRPRYDQAVRPGGAEAALVPVRFAVLGQPLAWRRYPGLGHRFTRRSPAARRPGLLLDFGRPVYGYLELGSVWRTPRRAALLFTGDRPLDPLTEALGEPFAAAGRDPAGVFEGGEMVLTLPGRKAWADTVPRRFRYAAVVGMRGLQDAWVEPVTLTGPEAEALPEPRRAEAGAGAVGGAGEGLWGIEPPPLRAPVEYEVWRELQRLADLAGRKRR